MPSWSKLIVPGIVIGIVVALAVWAITNQPDIFEVLQTLHSPCPPSVYNMFDIFLRNGGDVNAIICVNVSSSDVTFKKDQYCFGIIPNDPATKYSFDCTVPPLNGKNTTISFSYTVNKYFIPTKFSRPCVYRQDPYGTSLTLIE